MHTTGKQDLVTEPTPVRGPHCTLERKRTVGRTSGCVSVSPTGRANYDRQHDRTNRRNRNSHRKRRNTTKKRQHAETLANVRAVDLDNISLPLYYDPMFARQHLDVNTTSQQEEDLTMNTHRVGLASAQEIVQTALLIVVSLVGTWLALYRVPWRVSADPCLIAAAAMGVIVICLWLTRWQGVRGLIFERYLLGGFLVYMALVYVMRYLFASTGGAANHWLWVEILSVLIFAALAVLSVTSSPWLLAVGRVARISLGFLALSELSLHARLVHICLPGDGHYPRSVRGGACSCISESIVH
jgi:hypothetical protein